MAFPGTPLSCDQEENVRRNVSQVARGKPSCWQAGNTHLRSTLFGEIGFPDRVENTRS